MPGCEITRFCAIYDGSLHGCSGARANCSFGPKADFSPLTYVAALQRLQLFRDLFRASQNYLDIGVALRQGDCTAIRPAPWHVRFKPSNEHTVASTWTWPPTFIRPLRVTRYCPDACIALQKA
jgi:hypothetical protein